MLEESRELLRRLLFKKDFCDAVENEDWKKVEEHIWRASTKVEQFGDINYYLYNDLGINFLEKIEEPQYGLFYETDLRYIDVPRGVKYISVKAFYNTPLEAISLPASIVGIFDSAFAESNLENIFIPNSVTYIGSSVFQNCSKLKTVTVSDSVVDIQAKVFEGCSNLTVRCPAGSHMETYCKRNNLKYEVI